MTTEDTAETLSRRNVITLDGVRRPRLFGRRRESE